MKDIDTDTNHLEGGACNAGASLVSLPGTLASRAIIRGNCYCKVVN
jgi:hypothetical protein